MKKFLLLLLVAVTSICAGAQIVTTSPSPLLESSDNVVLTFNAASPLCNGALKNLASTTALYAHIGVITNRSTGDSDWKYTVCPWPESGNLSSANTDKNRLTYVSANTYTLELGSLRGYFGLTDPTEYIQKIAIVFRNADGSKECKTSSGGDIFVNVTYDGFAIELGCDHSDRILSGTTTVNFTVEATKACNMSLSVNGSDVASVTNTTRLTSPYTFSEVGTYTVTATSVYEGVTYSESMEFSYPAPSQNKNYPGGVPRQGAVKNSDGTVTFCLAAPGKSSVMIVGSWDDYAVLDSNLMNYQDYEGNRYFWITVAGLANDVYYPYYYIVDDTYKVADPYAHLVLDCYSDSSLRNSVWMTRPKYPSDKLSNVMLAVYRGDLDDYEFSDFTIPDHGNLVIYELLLRDFTGYNGLSNGWGTVKAAKEKIPYIKAMGFNAIELLPIMEFNGNNSWGYNTNFYMAPDKAYGSPTDYKDFIEACHQEGIAVILDIVFNQSDGLHPWYQMYPIESNPFYNKTAPHSYSVLNDWKQDNELVQQQWTDALKYWMEAYNVDGFRFDLVKGLGDNGSYGAGTEAYNQSRVDRMKRLHAVIKSVKPNGIHINENLAGATEEKAMGEDGQLNWANVNDASCQFAMGWDDGGNNLQRFLSTSDSARPWGTTVSYAESHDEQRMGFKCETYGAGDVPTDELTRYRRLGTLAAQMLLTPGPKMVWQFGELGDSQDAKNKDGSNNTDPKMVDWRWLDDPYKSYLMQTYGALINLRMDNPELVAQSASFSSESLALKFNRQRSMVLKAGNKEVVAFINPSLTDDITVNVTSSILTSANAKLVWASQEFTPELSGNGTSLSVNVPAGCFAVFATNTIASVSQPGAASSDVRVYGGYGCIRIEGEYSNVVVSDLSGRCYPTLDVAPGLYIVNVDGHVAKVVVK